MNTSTLLMQLNQLDDNHIKQLQPSFNRLPGTSHADGGFRLRRYSIVHVFDSGVEKLPPRPFMQTSDINEFQGDVARMFEDIEPETVQTPGFHAMCRTFRDLYQLSDDNDIEIHQIRIQADDQSVQVAPEGVHQDGFDYIAIVSVGRDNIEGGDFKVFRHKTSAPLFSLPLMPGEMAALDDRALWHYAEPIIPVNHAQSGTMDVFVLTATRK